MMPRRFSADGARFPLRAEKGGSGVVGLDIFTRILVQGAITKVKNTSCRQSTS
jgi:hypothetical protein